MVLCSPSVMLAVRSQQLKERFYVFNKRKCRYNLTLLSQADVLVEVGKTNYPGSRCITILCQTLILKKYVIRVNSEEGFVSSVFNQMC
jgi:hypothetical protein